MRLTHRIIVMIGAKAIALLLLAAMPAVAQSEEFLFINAGNLCGLQMEAGGRPGMTWTRIDLDAMERAAFFSFRLSPRDPFGRPTKERLPGLGRLILESIVLDRSDEEVRELFEQRFRPDTVQGIDTSLIEGLLSRYRRGYDDRNVDTDGYDPELLRRYREWGRSVWERALRSDIFLAPYADGRDDPIAVIATLDDSTRQWSVSLANDSLALALARTDGRERGSVEIVMIQESIAWESASDSIAVTAWLKEEGIRGARVYTLDWWDLRLFFWSEEELMNAVGDVWYRGEPRPYTGELAYLFSKLSVSGFPDSAFRDSARNLLRTYRGYYESTDPETLKLDAFYEESEYNFTDTAAWARLAAAFRASMPRYLSIAYDFYAVVVDDSVRSVLAFPFTDPATAPTIMTFEELTTRLSPLELEDGPMLIPPLRALMHSVEMKPCGAWPRLLINY